MSRFDWADVLPAHVVIAQKGWERKRMLRRMRALGFTFREIAGRLERSVERARQLAGGNSPLGCSPVEGWFADGYIEKLSRGVKASHIEGLVSCAD